MVKIQLGEFRKVAAMVWHHNTSAPLWASNEDEVVVRMIEDAKSFVAENPSNGRAISSGMYVLRAEHVDGKLAWITAYFDTGVDPAVEPGVELDSYAPDA